ncbi:hypothetical protein AVEN_97492-1 [Araneus ventricosus]|uniref:Zinc finger PHD-type domain-containing protein n=1 Tax=Araneus ventricosus TaxID=182803 RepID=A0A4Y2NTE7_ARAVE|nr:hypothetical protein AVEN_97492-1 [Araneus ventricosus]
MEKNSVDKKFKNKKNIVLKENLGNVEHQTKKTFDSDEEDDDENCLCIYRLNPYEESSYGEQLVQCNECQRWEYEDCITNGNSKYFACKNCESDFENC